jgi:3-deoxy-D-manno-octulosonate 8-phosphate phosphatase (KDO 8-P phosphatase)
MFLLDIDGVLTDGSIYLDNHGVETKRFSVRDGFGLVWCRRFGLQTGVISGRASPATLKRCQDLQMDEIHLGNTDKLDIFQTIRERHKLASEQIAFMGDDLLDLPVLEIVGLAACPSDAHPTVRSKVHFVSSFPGGKGAVRELIDLWLEANGHWDEAVKAVRKLNTR